MGGWDGWEGEGYSPATLVKEVWSCRVCFILGGSGKGKKLEADGVILVCLWGHDTNVDRSPSTLVV